jgi:spectinomycin phosphotransferase
VREPPDGVTDDEILAAVRDAWLPSADAVEHLPVGFGAHHWRALREGEPRLFVTLDSLAGRHDARSLHAAYAAAAHLAADGLEFVHPNLDPVTVVLGSGVLSATRWRAGEVREQLDLAETASMVARLHAATVDDLPRWTPLVRADFADRLRGRLATAWDGGAFAAQAHAALRDRLDAIAEWTQRYHALAALAREERWMPTHGEPHERNQLVTPDGTLLVDWESLRLAPRERDLRVLIDAGASDIDASRPMVEMFDLEWRLDEISQYADRFESPHTGNASDRVALGGLLEELERAEWFQPGR